MVINIRFEKGKRERISCYYKYDSDLMLRLKDVDIDETEQIRIHAANGVEEKAVNLDMIGEYLYKVDDSLLMTGNRLLLYVVVVGQDYLVTTQEVILELSDRAELPQ